MRRTRSRHAGGMILTEYGLRFAKDGDCWRCVEYPDLVMLPGERYRAPPGSAGTNPATVAP